MDYFFLKHRCLINQTRRSRMKTAVVLTGFLAALAISAQAFLVPTISVSDLAVTGATNADGSNITVTATIVIDDSTHGGQVMLSVRSTDQLVGQLWQPREVTFVAVLDTDVSGTCIWTNTDETWNPYFTGDYVVTIVATDLANGTQGASSTTVTVNRADGGVMKSVQVPVDVSATAYDANMAFTNIDLSQVFVHIPGMFLNAGAFSIPMNLMNVTNPVFVSEEQTDIAFMDTGKYRRAGTPFRFDMDMHARPTSIMGFGEIMRFVWTPTVATDPAGSGNLSVDIVSCQPWRSGYATNFSAHVGCAPLFMTDTNVADMMEGMIMSTTAHYFDVNPTNSDVGIGLTVNGQSNKTSNLKALSLMKYWPSGASPWTGRPTCSWVIPRISLPMASVKEIQLR